MATTITIDKSLLMRVTWTRAYEAALAAGTSVRQHLSAAMRSAWADWRECVADGEIRMTLSKEYDDRYGRMDRAMMRRRIAAAAKAVAMVPQVAQQQQAQAAAPAPTPRSSEWVITSSRIEADNLLGVIAADRATVVCASEWYLRALPVVRVDGYRHIMLGHARNEAAAADLGTHAGYQFDVAVRVIGEDGPLAYVLLGDGEPADVSPEDLRRLVAHAAFKATISAVDAEDDEVDECSEHAVRWFVGEGDNRWSFDGHNPACAFAEMCDAVGFVPALDGSPPMVQQQAQQQQACAAAPVAHPVGVPTNAWLDEEVRTFIDGVIRELMPEDDDGAPRPRVDALEVATLDAYVATKAWVEMFERECAVPFSVPYGDLFDARQAMQAAHARLDALTAKAAS